MPGASGSFVFSDLDGDPRLANGEDRLVVKHGCAHVGELAELAIGEFVDRARVIDDAWIRHQETRDVRPVLVNVGGDAAGDDGARHVAAPA